MQCGADVSKTIRSAAETSALDSYEYICALFIYSSVFNILQNVLAPQSLNSIHIQVLLAKADRAQTKVRHESGFGVPSCTGNRFPLCTCKLRGSHQMKICDFSTLKDFAWPFLHSALLYRILTSLQRPLARRATQCAEHSSTKRKKAAWAQSFSVIVLNMVPNEVHVTSRCEVAISYILESPKWDQEKIIVSMASIRSSLRPKRSYLEVNKVSLRLRERRLIRSASSLRVRVLLVQLSAAFWSMKSWVSTDPSMSQILVP